ncbi:metallophosphoesterase [Methanobrevibacter sp.]|uniref:metallophosphoesterase n=1 Tax=Methanobrevibacter sp. TaxID=66852 RepID=UPI0025E2E022|nr:metallophosphoesterase [Methanobrevibacter sp.]MBQ2962755.1 metallophosphoesterase [Methanobrevibacter sp.]
MSFRTRRVIMSTPFMMLYEFFLMKYLFLLFGGLEDIYLLLLTVLFAILKIVPMLFEERKSRRITRFLDHISAFWIFMSLFTFFDLLLIYAIGAYIELPIYIIVLLLMIVPLITIYSYCHAHKIIVHEKIIELDNINQDMNIAHLSDVHFGSIRHKEIINDIRDKINQIPCDLAIISGDLADGSCVVEEDDFLAFRDVNVPIIFTSGNHDYYPGIENVHKACRKAGIIVLDNEGMEFKDLNIFGIPFSFDNVDLVGADELKSFIKEDKVNIINFHVPRNWEEFSRLGFDIQLSGHTHGGQFYPVTWIGNLLFYNMGLFKNRIGEKERYLHVTTGVGSMDYPFRWGTDSELVLLKLRKK